MKGNDTLSGRTRVLHVVFSLEAGGMENGIINVAHSLAGDFTIQVACLEARGRMACRIDPPNAVHLLNKKRGFCPKTVWRLAEAIHQFRPHVLHTHNLGPLIYGSLATAFGQTLPILHGEHSQFSAEDLSPKRLRQRRLFYRSVRRIHTVSKHLTREILQEKLGLTSSKVQPIVNGVDTSRFRPDPTREARVELKIPPNVPVIGIVGRFGPYKQHDLLIEAFEKIRTRGFPAHLVVIGGGGSEESRIRRRCAVSPEAAAIHWLGFSEKPERLYSALDLLAVPSRNEGLSNVVLEAMACEVPVLSHPSCGSSEIIVSGTNGIVADLSTADVLGGELESLLSDPERLHAMGKLARRSMVEQFSLARMARNYADLYRKLREE